MDNKWVTWLFASITNHFASYASTENVPIFIEGQFQNTDQLPLFIEQSVLRMVITNDGPQALDTEITISIIIHCIMKENENMYKVPDLIGVFLKAFANIPIYKYGKPGQPQLGCMTQEAEIIVTNLGQINPKDEYQATLITSDYLVHLTEGD